MAVVKPEGTLPNPPTTEVQITIPLQWRVSGQQNVSGEAQSHPSSASKNTFHICNSSKGVNRGHGCQWKSWSPASLCQRLYCRFHKPTTDELRWPLQAGASAGLAALLLTFLPPLQAFFGTAGVIGPVISVIALEATAGGSLRRAWWIAISSGIGSLLGYALYALSTLNARTIGEPYVPYLILFCAVFLTVPAGFLRFWYPSVVLGVNMGLSTGEVVLLSAYGGSAAAEPWEYALKRTFSSIIGSLCTVIATQCVLAKAARPTAANSLATILACLSEILEPLASLGKPQGNEVVRVTSSSALLFSSYPQLVGRPWRVFSDPAVGIASPFHDIYHHDEASLSERLAPEKQQCELMVKNINKCQALLSAQQGLIESAAQEISWRKPYRFPRRKYEAIVNEIRTLLFHIASLVFAVNLSITTLESAAANELSNTVRSQGLSLAKKERSNWRIPLRSRLRKMYRTPLPRPQQSARDAEQKNSKNEMANNNTLSSMPTVGKTPSTLLPPPGAEHSDGGPPTNGEWFKMCSGGDDAWAQIEGALLGRIAGHMSESLKLMANCLTERTKTTDRALQEIQNAANGIHELEIYRKTQRQNFAAILLTTLEADVTAVWGSEEEGSSHIKPPQLDWISALGVDAATYRSLHASDKLEYWQAYWLGRDRISSCNVTLNTIKDSLFRCSRLLDDYVGIALRPSERVFHLLP